MTNGNGRKDLTSRLLDALETPEPRGWARLMAVAGTEHPRQTAREFEEECQQRGADLTWAQIMRMANPDPDRLEEEPRR